MKRVLFIIALGISAVSCSYEPVIEITTNNYYSKKVGGAQIEYPVINDTIIEINP